MFIMTQRLSSCLCSCEGGQRTGWQTCSSSQISLILQGETRALSAQTCTDLRPGFTTQTGSSSSLHLLKLLLSAGRVRVHTFVSTCWFSVKFKWSAWNICSGSVTVNTKPLLIQVRSHLICPPVSVCPSLSIVHLHQYKPTLCNLLSS